VVARHQDGQLVILDRLREMVRLGAGLTDNGRLDDEAISRALRCLERFGQRLRAMHAGSVRVVGTNALRRARRKRWFLERARAALGHPIEIISGLEEARLIYSGVAHTSPMSPDKRLVIDIGGGSTELVIGEGFNPLLLESLSVGCVGLTMFDDGRISEKRFERARTAVRLELEPVQAAYRKLGWLQVFGSSGTVRVIADVIRRCYPDNPRITLDNLQALTERVIAAGHIDELELLDVDAERAPVFPGGLAILLEVVENLGIERVRVAEGAMRVCARCARWRSATTWRPRRPTASKRLPRRCWRRSNPNGGSRILWPSRRCAGRPACTRLASTSPTRSITGTAPICSSMPTCPDSRAKSSSCSPCWSARIAASCPSRRSNTSCLPGITTPSF
jgi:exopolyphosphatase/guanosine-5'-triphosphate,3'-diphosphate pyrophosphatase